MLPDDRKYTQEHEWIQVEGEIGTLGITDFAANELGALVYVELSEPGTEVNAGESVGTVESVKTASDIYTPVSGEIVEINSAVVEDPELVNRDALDEGWLLRIRLADPAELDQLLGPKEYEAMLGG